MLGREFTAETQKVRRVSVRSTLLRSVAKVSHRTTIRFCLLAVCTAAGVYILFFHHLGRRDLWSSHEARAAQNALMMLDTGAWGLPRLMTGAVEMQKPPMFYWLTASIGWLQGGVDTWAVRLPSAVSATAGAVGVWFFFWLRGRPVAGWLAAFFLTTMVHYTWLGRTGRIDMPLALFVSVSLGCFYLGRRQWQERRYVSARLWQMVSWIAMAMGVLLKGPIGVVLPMVVIVSHAFMNAMLELRNEKSISRRGAKYAEIPLRTLRLCVKSAYDVIRSIGLWWGLPLTVLFTAPWFVWANQQTNGEFFRVFFYYHNFQRGFGGAEELEVHAWWFYGVRILIDLFPWSLLLPTAVFWFFRRRRWQEDADARFGFIWFITVVFFLSLMKFKRADYLLPAYAGAALFLGSVAERWLQTASPTVQKVFRRSMTAAVATCCLGWMLYVDFYLPRCEAAREEKTFAVEIRTLSPSPQPIILFRTESHNLVFHLGRPVERIVEWENLDVWACQPFPVYVVMPTECAGEWERYLEAGRLTRVISNSEMADGGHEEPLVLLCSCPGKL